jgi:hypothetical protein
MNHIWAVRIISRYRSLLLSINTQVPHPLGDQLPALLSPGRVAAPAIGINFLIFIRERRLKGTTMQVQLDDIGGSEGVLRQIREEEFVDDARTRDANRALLFTSWMGCHDHTARHALGSHRHLRAVVEAADHLTFRTLLELIRRQVQTRLDQRMIECAVLFATGHKGKASQISEHGSGAILAVKPEQRALRGELIRREILTNGGESLSQLLSVASIAFVPKTAEPTFSCEPG